MRVFLIVLTAVVFQQTGGVAQTLSFNSLGNDPVKGTFHQLEHKDAEGEWTIRFYNHAIIEVNYLKYQLPRQEQVSESVIAVPAPQKLSARKTRGISVELENLLAVIWQQNQWYIRKDKNVLVKQAAYWNDSIHRGFEFVLAEDEYIYGGGERAVEMNRRGKAFTLYNQPHYGYEYGADALNFSVPFFISSKGYGLFFNNVSKGFTDIGKTDPNKWRVGFTSGALQFYVVAGDSPAEILSNYHRLTGTQPLPPRWAFGNFVSRFGYRSEQQVDAVLDSMFTHEFPMDAVIFDLFWFGDSIQRTLGNLDWVNRQQWPDPAGMLKKLQAKHLKSVLIVEPFVLEQTRNYQSAIPFLAVDASQKTYRLKDFYFGEGGLLDIFRKPAQQWMWKFYRQQIKNGVTGWWTDLGEPETHPQDLYHNLQDLGFKRLFAADEVHNAYGHYWNKFLFESFQKEQKNQRLFHLNRSGFAGSQRYSVFPWTGDVSRTWGGLKAQLPILLGMSLSGIPYIHADAGGFSMVDAKDPILYTRWLQFASFTPVFRPHGTALGELEAPEKDIPSEPALWPSPYRDITREYIRLRYALLPYNYNLAFEQTAYGLPLMRSMNIRSFDTVYHRSLDQQYFWGDALLVHPVVNASTSEMITYLPDSGWYDFYQHTYYKGNEWVRKDYSLAFMPLFVKAGSVIPVWKHPAGNVSIDQYKGDSLILLYYPGEHARQYEWFDDDGASANSLERAAYELLHFNTRSREGAWILSVNTPIANTGRLRKRVFEVHVPAVKPVSSVKVNGQEVPFRLLEKGVSNLQEGKFYSFNVVFNGERVEVEIR